MKKNHHYLLLIVFFLTSPMQLFGRQGMDVPQSGASQTQTRPLPAGVSIFQLDNGMQVLLIENPAVPMVGVNVVVKIGSAYETFSTSGMSHMLEHLLFNGTTSRTQKQLYDDVDRIGGYNNASTAHFYTNYMIVTPAENIQKGMEIQADMLFNSTLPPDKFEKEKRIVLEEIAKSLANPQEQIERNAASVLYSGHALSLPTLGTYSTVKTLSRDQVFSFYKTNYVPNNMILTAIGNFQTKQMLATIKEIYGNAHSGFVQRDALPEWATGFQTPASFAQRREMVYHRFYEGQDLVLQLSYQLPRFESSESYALLNIVLEKKKDEIRQSLKSGFPQVVKSLKLSARVSPLKSFVEAVIFLTSNNVDLDALARSVSAKLSNLQFSLSPEALRVEATKARTDFLKNIEKPHMFGIYNSDEIVINGVESVLESYTGSRYYQAGRELEALKLPSLPLIVVHSPAAKKEDERAEAAGETKLFRNTTSGKSLVVVQNKLSSLLAVHYLVKHKALYESQYGNDAAKILHDCFDQRMKSEENQKRSSQFGLTFVVNDNPFIPMDDIYLHPDFGYIRAEGLAEDMAGVFSYLNTQLKGFTPTEEEFKKAVEKYKGIETMLMGGDKAKKLFDEKYQSLVYEPSPYAVQKPLTYDNLLGFAREYFQPANMVVSVVSPAQPDTVAALMSHFYEGSIPPEHAVYDKSISLLQKDTTVEKEGKGERSYLFWGFATPIDRRDAAALQALSLVLSDRIVFDIREKQGMAYHMSAGIEVIGNRALFYINQGTRPQNVDKLVPQYRRFFTLAAIHSLTQAELEKSINMYLGRMMFRRLSSINQAFYLGSSLYFHDDIHHDKKFLDELKKVTLADVNDVAKKYMNVKNAVLVVVR